MMVVVIDCLFACSFVEFFVDFRLVFFWILFIISFRQYTSVRKAINSTECPVKEKHIRSKKVCFDLMIFLMIYIITVGIVIGTYLAKSGQIFWSYARQLQLDGHPIVCWKFCHVLHKLIRDGHPKTIPDSYRYRTRLLELCKMWGLLKHGYGRLIQNYCSLLVNKIDFHIRVSCFQVYCQFIILEIVIFVSK